MKKIFSLLLVFAFCLSLIVPSTAQAAVKLNKEKATMEVDSTLKLKLGTLAGNAPTWKSSNTKIVSVTKWGTITAKLEGTATITATYEKEKYTCKVTVVDSSKTCDVPKQLSPGIWIVGEDIPEGKYTLSAISGMGSLSIYKSYEELDSEDGIWSVFEMMGNVKSTVESLDAVYALYSKTYNANLKDGQCIQIGGVTLSVTAK